MTNEKLSSEQKQSDFFNKIYKKLFNYFNDGDKTILWLITPNLLLGGIEPIDMIAQGRGQKLLSFINTQIEEGRRP